MGINTKLVPVLPTALGASEVRPLDLCSAYTVFPMSGSRCIPMGLVRVTDSDGTLLEEYIPQEKTNLLKPSTISQMDEALAGVVEHGTGTAARSGNDGVVEGARGKTGTTSDSKDAWFAGYSPELTTVVWVANVRKHQWRSRLPQYGTGDGRTRVRSDLARFYDAGDPGTAQIPTDSASKRHQLQKRRIARRRGANRAA